MKWLKRILIALALLLAMAVALSFFISLNDYIPQIENRISSRIKEPVTIKNIRFIVLPVPHVTIDSITVGTTNDIKLGKVLVTPDLFSLLQPTMIIKSVELDSLVLTQNAIDKIPAWSKPEASGPSQVRVESIRLSNALVNFGQTSFGPFDARITLDDMGDPVNASIATQNGSIKLFIKPEQGTYLIDASAKKWALPIDPAIMFDELNVKGVATLDHANFSQVSARLYDGTASGTANVSWEKGWHLDGKFDVRHVEMQKIATMLSSSTHVSGRLTAKPVLSASAASADQLVNALRLETPFNVEHGVLYGVDIQKAATGLIKHATTGGETRFDQLSGHLVMEHGGYHLTQLRITSGTLAVDGNVNVSPTKELSGRITARVSAVGTSASVPLNVKGTVGAPLLYPTGGAIAGAAVGTVILGPGLGTSVGAKVGGWAEGLFGNKEAGKPKK